ncbi:rhodanese-like domain-containing protein [Nonomuraea sp. B10E15]|uniref:rhodanese-like domain-containing protein n=1 Tax=Nonomuraea sp. B10E15 TaxID=3153560 RepID=UPI00325C5A00
MTSESFITYDEIKRWRDAGKAHALLDVRERGEYALGQIPGSCPLPRGLIEICLRRLVPWKNVPLVLYSNDDHRSRLAAQTCRELGHDDVRVLEGGLNRWSKEGNAPVYGVNVIGKTFGERLSITDQVQQLDPDGIAALADRTETFVFDARTAGEYAKGHIPGAFHVPGGELVPTLCRAGIEGLGKEHPIVVHCAGRTRSIVGAYLLKQAGFSNVYALRNGTMAWVMSGRELSVEARPWTAPAADEDGQERAAAFAEDFVHGTRAFPLQVSEAMELIERDDVCYMIDVRLVDEYVAGHVPDALSCPAGQLANAVDEHIGVRDALLVCYSNDETRARIGAGLLSRIGYRRVAWLTGGIREWSRGGGAVVAGSPQAYLDDLSLPGPDIRTIAADRLQADLTAGSRVLVDVRRSSEYALSHIPGSVWVPRGDLERRIETYASPGTSLAVASDRELRSTLAARTLLSMGYEDVVVLGGGINRWIASGHPVEEGLDGADVSLAEAKEDAELVARRPKMLERNREDMVRYLDWEERLGEELLSDAESSTGKHSS